MDQKIEAPNDADVDRIARQLIHAQDTVEELSGSSLDGSEADLALIQIAIDSGAIEPTATYTLQSLGLLFGRIFIENSVGYDWWMVEDEYGRDPALRYKETTLLAFPQTMISRRVEDGEVIDCSDLYNGLKKRLEEIRDESYSAA
jgi:hypothetical protein